MAMRLLNAAAVKILESVGYVLWSLRPALMRDIVQQHGVGKSLWWFATHMPRYEKILKNYGAIRTHLLATEISMLNGCVYCTYGHAYAFQLHYFEKFNKPFKVDEHKLVAMAKLPFDKKIEQFRRVLNEADLSQEKKDFARMSGLYSLTTKTENDFDKDIHHLITMFRFLNTCGITGCTTPDQAHDPINKNHDLKHAYNRARQLA